MANYNIAQFLGRLVSKGLFSALAGALLLGIPAQANWLNGPDKTPPCFANPPVLTAWQNLRYPWYHQLPETSQASYHDILSFPLQPRIQQELDQFYARHYDAIHQYRHCQFQAWSQGVPITPQFLASYNPLPLNAALVDEDPLMKSLRKLWWQPEALVFYLQRVHLAQQISAQQQAHFYMRQALGQARFYAEPLPRHKGWRVWLDSYDYVLAVDLFPDLNHRVHGLWQRQPKTDESP